MSRPLTKENCKEQCRNREYQVVTQDCKNKTKEVTTENRGHDLSSELGHQIWGNPFEAFKSGPIA